MLKELLGSKGQSGPRTDWNAVLISIPDYITLYQIISDYIDYIRQDFNSQYLPKVGHCSDCGENQHGVAAPHCGWGFNSKGVHVLGHTCLFHIIEIGNKNK